jgi:hypothetical protein
MGTLLGPTLHTLGAHQAAFLTGRTFFPDLISNPFIIGMHVTFAFSVIMMLVGATASWLRGGSPARPAAARVIARADALSPPVSPGGASASRERATPSANHLHSIHQELVSIPCSRRSTHSSAVRVSLIVGSGSAVARSDSVLSHRLAERMTLRLRARDIAPIPITSF